MRPQSIGVGRPWHGGRGQVPGPVFEGRRAWMAQCRLRLPAARCTHALPSRIVSARAALGPRPGAGALPGGPERPDPSVGRRAVRPKPASVGPDAGAAEPQAGPRAPTLQARGAFLGAPMAHARLADAALGARRPGAGGAGAVGPGGRAGPRGAGQRALWSLGGVHPGRGLAWADAAAELGRAALSVAHRAGYPHRLPAAAPGRGGLAPGAPRSPAGRPRLPLAQAVHDAAPPGVGLDGAPARAAPGR